MELLAIILLAVGAVLYFTVSKQAGAVIAIIGAIVLVFALLGEGVDFE